MPRAAKKKQTYAELRAKLAGARVELEKLSAARKKARRAEATAAADEQCAAKFAECQKLQRQLVSIKEQEMQRHPQHFRKSHEDKAKLLFLGWVEGGPNKLTHHHFPAPESYLMEECLWSLVTILRSKTTQMDFMQSMASLFVPDDNDGLAHPLLVARIGRRKVGAPSSSFGPAQIVAAVATFEQEGFKGRGCAGDDQWYPIEREYVSECLRNATPTTIAQKRKLPRD